MNPAPLNQQTCARTNSAPYSGRRAVAILRAWRTTGKAQLKLFSTFPVTCHPFPFWKSLEGVLVNESSGTAKQKPKG